MNRFRSHTEAVICGLVLCAFGAGISFTLSVCIGGLMAPLG